MNILAIDTTTKKASVVVKKDNTIISKTIDNEITHSEKLLPLIHETLEEANLKLQDIHLLACTLGPGSFTGVRIGIATMKALAKVIDTKIYGITSLELLAMDGIKNSTNSFKQVLSLMDARNDRVYFNLYNYNKDVLEDTNYSGNDYLESVLENTPNLSSTLIVVDNAELINDKNLNVIQGNLDLTNILNMDMSKNIYTYLDLDAKYYRKSEAERTKKGE